MRNKTINRILIKEIIKEYLGVVLTIVILPVLLYISVYVAKSVIFVFILYFVISLKYIIQSFKNESLFLHIYRTNKSSIEEAKALVESLISLYSNHNKNQTKNQIDNLNHISVPIYTRRSDILKSSEHPVGRIYGTSVQARMNSGANRKKRLNKYSKQNAIKTMRRDKKRFIVFKRLKWLYDQHEY